MSLLDIIRGIPERMGRGQERNIGGLLGIDPEDMTEEERRQARRLSQMAVFDAMARGTSPIAGLREAAALLGSQREARQERAEREQRMGAAQQASSQIAGRLMGGMPLPTAPGPVAGDELTGVNVQSAYRRDPQDALRMAMTPAGVDAMQINPFLAAPLQEMLKPREAVKPTSDITNYLLASKDPKFAEFLSKRQPQTNITVDTAPKASQVALESFNKRLDDAWSSATSAENTLYSVSVMEDALARGTPTGAAAEGIIGVSQILDSLGVDYNKEAVANAQAFKAQSSVLLASIMDQLGGARGITPEELKLLQQQFPQIVDNNEARKAVFRILRKASERTVNQYNEILGQFKEAYPGAIVPYRPKVIIDQKKLEDFAKSPEGQKLLQDIMNGL